MQAMENRDGAQTPFEVYCHDCKCSFAVGTRVCVHCGRRLGRPGSARLVPGLEPTGEEALEEVSPLRRIGGISLWVLIALGAAITRMCEGGA